MARLLSIGLGVLAILLALGARYQEYLIDTFIRAVFKAQLLSATYDEPTDTPILWEFKPKETYHAKRRPNIILILADDLGYNDLLGSQLPVTKNIRRLGERGVDISKLFIAVLMTYSYH